MTKKTRCNCERNEYGYHAGPDCGEEECTLVAEMLTKDSLVYSVDGEIECGETTFFRMILPLFGLRRRAGFLKNAK